MADLLAAVDSENVACLTICGPSHMDRVAPCHSASSRRVAGLSWQSPLRLGGRPSRLLPDAVSRWTVAQRSDFRVPTGPIATSARPLWWRLCGLAAGASAGWMKEEFELLGVPVANEHHRAALARPALRPKPT